MPHYHGKDQHANSGQVTMNIFAPYTAEQVEAIRMGTPAYQTIHPYNKAMSSGTPASHYKSLVQPSMSKASKSMPKHLGMNSLFIGSKFNGLS
jgi:hypothetical protein